MPGPIVQIKCSQCKNWYPIRLRDIKRLADPSKPLCADCRRLGENNPNWLGGISRDRGRYSAIMRQRHPEHYHARRLAEYARRTGKLVAQPCEECKNLNVEMHHEDYSQPYQVRWLCPLHHDEADAEKKARNR